MGKKNPANIKGRKLPFVQLRSVTYTFLKSNQSKVYSARQILKKLKISNSKNDIVRVLEQLVRERKVHLHQEGQYQVVGGRPAERRTSRKLTGPTIIGVVDMTRTGSAYIVPENDGQDVYVAQKHLLFAMEGDTVEVRVKKSHNGKPSGKVLRIIERKKEHLIGTFQQLKNYGVVDPGDDTIPFEIIVMPGDTMDASDGDMVVTKITEWFGHQNKMPKGVITEVLGAAGSHDIEMKSILIQNGFDLSFSKAVEEEIKAIPSEITQEEIEKRRDFREVLTITIDPFDAKDFDDALSIRYLENGDCEIGIHIADVTHYLKSGTQLDKEAYDRSTSVYLVDRVLPMLPEKLSNELCSLRPQENSLTFSAVFVFDHDLNITDKWFGRTVIFSDHRFAYEEAQKVLETGDGPYAAELKQMNRIANRLRKDKFKNGAISFETDEVQFRLDENGNPIDIWTKERMEAHMLIEDFMLLANREVAHFMAHRMDGKPVPFVYRVHDLPDEVRVEEFSRFAKQLGFQMQYNTPREISDSLNRLAKEAKNDERLKLLEPIAIRTMAKAIYTTENIGHYGLAFEYYTHFTSPIRRYSDVLVHRLLYENLDKIHRADAEKLEMKCKHISTRERDAVRAERESIKYKQVQYIKEHIGEVFEGYVSGMIDSGFFVALSHSRAEGLIGWHHFDESFKLADSRLVAVGNQSGRQIKMGDTVQVKILDADLSKRQIEMLLVDPSESKDEDNSSLS
jgi:ribonuclease R